MLSQTVTETVSKGEIFSKEEGKTVTEDIAKLYISKTKNNEDSFLENEKLNIPVEIVYGNILKFGYWHLAALYGIYLCFTSAKWATILFTFFLYSVAQIGVTAGAHRLWSHKTYKAKLPLEILLMVMHSIASQDTAANWVRDHRVHHKYSETDADPHNSLRGLFYSHIGWLFVRKHPEVKRKGKVVDMSDIYSNPLLRFQKKYAFLWISTVAFILPTIIPMYFWGETLINAWHLTMLRYIMNMNVTLLINSIAHRWGNRPYDNTILPADNKGVSFLTFGEGYHNYHHVFPWDYRTGELGNNFYDLTTMFINFFAWIGWAYDLKTVPKDIVKARANRTGANVTENVWGWDDNDFDESVKNSAEILYRKNENKKE